jgi:hypothetical protein
MFCKRCGKELGAKDIYCSTCGEKCATINEDAIQLNRGSIPNVQDTPIIPKKNSKSLLHREINLPIFLALAWLAIGVILTVLSVLSSVTVPVVIFFIFFVPLVLVLFWRAIRKYMRGEMKKEVRNVWVFCFLIILLIGIFILLNRSEFDSCYKKCLDNGIAGRYCITSCGKR